MTDDEVNDINTELALETAAIRDGQKTPHIDPEEAKRYAAYLKDWRWRMDTFSQMQREYMGSGGYKMPGERCF